LQLKSDFNPSPHGPRSNILHRFLSSHPIAQQLADTMQHYFNYKILLLLTFGLLVVMRGIRAEDKAPPTSLQIGIRFVSDANCRD
jgi:hypothetical protein